MTRRRKLVGTAKANANCNQLVVTVVGINESMNQRKRPSSANTSS